MIQAKELFDSGKFSAAIMTLQDGLKNYPHFISARVLLGEIYWTSGEVASAKAELEQVIKEVPDNFAAHRKLAMIYRESGEFELAIRSCRTVLHANPRDLEMRALLDQLQSGPAHAHADKGALQSNQAASSTQPLAEAAVAAKEALSAIRLPAGHEAVVDADQPEAIDTETLAELYLIQGHREKGLAVYRRLAAKNPGNSRFLDRIAALERPQPVQESQPAEPLASVPPVTAEDLTGRNRRSNQVRRLEGWLQVIRNRRRL
jgi:tetratricopeptide (TPR) repeat protein